MASMKCVIPCPTYRMHSHYQIRYTIPYHVSDVASIVVYIFTNEENRIDREFVFLSYFPSVIFPCNGAPQLLRFKRKPKIVQSIWICPIP